MGRQAGDGNWIKTKKNSHEKRETCVRRRVGCKQCLVPQENGPRGAAEAVADQEPIKQVRTARDSEDTIENVREEYLSPVL